MNKLSTEQIKLFRQVHHGILLFQRKMRTIRTVLPHSVDIIEGIILSHLSYDPESRTATELTKLLGLTKSKMSRLMSDLENNGYITTQAIKSDKRSKVFLFTPKGAALLQESDQLVNTISQAGTALFSEKQLKRFVELFSRLNTGLGAPKEKLRMGEFPLVPEQRRCVIATGMLAKSYMKTEFDLAGYHVFLELYINQNPFLYNELCNTLPIHASKISRKLSDLEKLGDAQRIIRESDQRTREYKITPTGIKHFDKMDGNIAKTLASAWGEGPASEVKEFIELLDLVAQAPLPKPEKENVPTLICDSEGLRTKARAFLVENLVKNFLHTSLDQHLLAKTNPLALALWRDEIVALLEVQKKGTAFELRNFFISPTVAEAESEMFSRLCRRLAKEQSVKSLHVKRSKVNGALFDTLGPGAGLKDEITLMSSL